MTSKSMKTRKCEKGDKGPPGLSIKGDRAPDRIDYKR